MLQNYGSDLHKTYKQKLMSKIIFAGTQEKLSDQLALFSTSSLKWKIKKRLILDENSRIL